MTGYLPHFEGLSVNEILSAFEGEKGEISKYLPDPHPTLKVPREFLVAVSLFADDFS